MSVSQVITFRTRPLIACIASALTLVILVGCGSQSATQTGETSATAHQPIHVSLDADRYEYNDVASMCQALYVADVEVGARGNSHWNTSNGQLPPGISKKAVIQQGYMLYTPVQLSNVTAHHDRRSKLTKEFVLVGGKNGPDTYSIDAFPQPKQGSHYLVVFAQTVDQASQQLVDDPLEVYSAYPIDANGIVTLQQAGSSKEPGSGKPQPEVTVKLSDVHQQLAGCK